MVETTGHIDEVDAFLVLLLQLPGVPDELLLDFDDVFLGRLVPRQVITRINGRIC